MAGMNNLLTRRSFISLLLGGLAVLGEDWFSPLSALAQSHGGFVPGEDFARFVFSQVVYSGGDWDPDPTAVLNLTGELETRTSVDAGAKRRDISLDDPGLFDFPFLYITGHQEFPPWSDLTRRRLSRFLSSGGFLLADDCAGVEGAGFDAAIRRELGALFPDRSLRRLASDHPVYRAFYIVRGVAARRLVKPYLEGIDIGERTAVMYCSNDVGCAWERDSLGNWIHPCVPGGETQRRQAFHLGVNIILYALTGTYKADLIHRDFIEDRLR